MTSKTLCVYCSSSDAVDPVHFAAAEQLGTMMAQSGYRLVYGGSTIGLMGAVARTVHQCGGQVIGVIPEALHARGLGYDVADEFLVTPDLRQRKAAMEARADAFIAMPGGFGTLEEIVEVLTLKQLKYHQKPIIFLNTAGFYDPLMTLFEHFYTCHFAKAESRALYHFVPKVADIFTYLDSYQPPRLPDKWIKG
ncbi:MAG TPA: TIGR00730 family Rossman fold protein [Phototrophicaceae bacterium]|nr:TIGR00730 family Rossman fold protein [Phototrophicaceae bacterium]